MQGDICYLEPRIWNIDHHQGRATCAANIGGHRQRFPGVPLALRIRFHPSSQIKLGRTMKKAALLLSGLLLSAFVSGAASAEVVRVRLTARVSQVDDANNALAGKIIVGQRVNGLYVYNTNTPNLAQDQNIGDYQPYANEARVRIAVGSTVFESKQPTQGIGIAIGPDNIGWGLFLIYSSDNKPLADGTGVSQIRVEFQGDGNVTQSVALPSVAPIPHTYSTREISVTANAPAGSYTVRAYIEAAELVVPDAVVVSPASGTFAANQHFDAAVILPRNSVVQNAHAMANGTLLPLTYPGSCQLQPQVGTGRPSLLCPGADAVLTMQPGAPIEWTVELTNGTIFTETVNWDRAP
jgi:hypothetical protein